MKPGRGSLSAVRRPPSGFAAFFFLPHLLGLDAPLVALGWQGWWTRSAGVSLTWAHGATLFLAVWSLYLADRLADAARPERADTATARHRFSRRWRRPLLGLLVGVLGALAVLSPLALSAADLRVGLALLVVEIGYFAWVHAGRGAGDGWPWKEAWVGASFAAGCALFPWRAAAPDPGASWWTALGAFAALCFLNCALIARWEVVGGASRGGNRLAAGCAALAVGSTLLIPWLPVAPVAAGAAGLWLLDRAGERLGPEARRVLADVALLAPWALLAGG